MDKERTVYLSSGCEIVDTESESCESYPVFPSAPKSPDRYIFKPVGSGIFPSATIAKVSLDRTLSQAIQPEVKAEAVKKVDKPAKNILEAEKDPQPSVPVAPATAQPTVTLKEEKAEAPSVLAAVSVPSKEAAAEAKK